MAGEAEGPPGTRDHGPARSVRSDGSECLTKLRSSPVPYEGSTARWEFRERHSGEKAGGFGIAGHGDPRSDTAETWETNSIAPARSQLRPEALEAAVDLG